MQKNHRKFLEKSLVKKQKNISDQILDDYEAFDVYQEEKDEDNQYQKLLRDTGDYKKPARAHDFDEDPLYSGRKVSKKEMYDEADEDEIEDDDLIEEDEDDEDMSTPQPAFQIAKQSPLKVQGAEPVNNFVGFSIAGNNKKLVVNPQNLEKAKKLFDDDEEEERPLSQPSEKKVFKNAASPGKQSPFIGFQTAGQNKLHIDPKKLEQAKQMLEADDDEFVPSQTFKTANKSRSSSQQLNPLTVSPKTLEKAKNFLENDEDVDTMPAFKIAGKGTLHIDPKKLENAKKLFEDDANEVPVSSQTFVSSKLKVQNPESLNLSQSLLRDKKPTGSALRGSPFKMTVKPIMPSVKNGPSKEALERARKLLEDDDEEAQETPEPVLFTAGGKKLQVNEANLKKAASLFADDQEEQKEEKNFPVTSFGFKAPAMNQFPTLQNASGKQISVNPASLDRIMKLFKDDDEDNFQEKPQATPSFNKFQPTPANQTTFSTFVKQMKSFSNPVSNENSRSIPLTGSKSEQSRENSNKLDSILEVETPNENNENEEEVTQVFKKKKLGDLRTKTSPTMITLQDRTNNLHGKFSVRPLENENKKINTFKLVEKKAGTKDNSGAMKTETQEKKPKEEDSKAKLKRNFDNFIDSNIGKYMVCA